MVKELHKEVLEGLRLQRKNFPKRSILDIIDAEITVWGFQTKTARTLTEKRQAHRSIRALQRHRKSFWV